MINANLTYHWLGPAIFIAAGVAFLLLFWHDRKQLSALRLAGAYFCAAIGFTFLMLAEGSLRPAYQSVVQISLFATHFLLIWGVASLYGQPVPRLAFGLVVLFAAGFILYTNLHPSLFWLRITVATGFIFVIDLMCGLLVWQARQHRVDVIVATVFLIQSVLTLMRLVSLHLPGAEPMTFAGFIGSEFSSSMQTANALFAIVLGLALFARYSTDLLTRLNRLVETDPLTGVLNRRAFESRVQQLRNTSAPLPTGLIICDIDQFKRVNDTYGHDVGDTVLKTVAQLLQNGAGEGSICARLGGEEFCILLPESNGEMTRLAATRLRVEIETQRIISSGLRLDLTASFGYCELAPTDDFRIAMTRVDAAVYQAKDDGRNLVRIAQATAGVNADAIAFPDRVARLPR